MSPAEGPLPPQYPEHDKMTALRSKIDVVTEFLEWAEAQGYLIGKHAEEPFGDCYAIIPAGIERLLADHFKIDLKKIEQEKRDMLDELRRMNEVRP